MEATHSISWENVDISAIPEIFKTAVVMNSPEEARAFYEATVKFTEAHYVGLFNKYAWENESFGEFTTNASNAMSVESFSVDTDGNPIEVGLYFADIDYYLSEGFNIICFSGIYNDKGSTIEESQYPIEALWR